MTDTLTPFNYKQTSEQLLRVLKNDRDRKIIARRFGLGLAKRQTLEQIGGDFGITRERVRQIEKAATTKIKASNGEAISQANRLLVEYLQAVGGISRADIVAAKLGAKTDAERSYVMFLAHMAPDIEVVEESDDWHPSLMSKQHLNKQAVDELATHLADALSEAGKPVKLEEISGKIPSQDHPGRIEQVGHAAKQVANLDEHWGLSHWPEVNPKSIRDKTYLVLKKHSEPLHFTDIAGKIKGLGNSKRDVTVQAVHNELIKDPRFILIGRGIYALSEWGYTPGTVADIIVEVLKNEQPLHKNEIVKRVLDKRQVKTTTIVLNLQDKDTFERIDKATYKLKDS